MNDQATLLSGIRVLDFGRYIAGPYCAALLADLGADVIRIERIEGGEDRWILPLHDDGVGALFVAMNRNKRGMTLDPASPEGREIVKKLVATADIVIANLPPDVLKSLALDLESLRAIKADIILSTTTAFGAGGPWSHRHGFDGIGQAMCGSVYMTGTPDQPLRAAATWVDFGTATMSALGTLAALMARAKNGSGQKVETALLHTALAFNNPMLLEQAVAKPDREPNLNVGLVSGPSDIYRTRDGWIMVSCVGNPMFRRMTRMLGHADWIDDPRFKDDVSRGRHGQWLSAQVTAWSETLTTAEALAAFETAHVPAAPVYSPQQALDDPHIRAIDVMRPCEYPGLGAPAPLARTPFDLSETPLRTTTRAPTLGEHTDEILREIGYDDAGITSLRKRKVI